MWYAPVHIVLRQLFTSCYSEPNRVPPKADMITQGSGTTPARNGYNVLKLKSIVHGTMFVVCSYPYRSGAVTTATVWGC